MVHIVPSTVLKAGYAVYLNANRKGPVRKESGGYKKEKQKGKIRGEFLRSEEILGTGKGLA